MTPLPMPLSPPLWGLASLAVTRPQLHAMLGSPHFVETDSLRTAGGDEDAWAYILDAGQRVLIVLEVPYHTARLIADPPEIGPVLRALGIAPDDPRLSHYPEPFRLD